MENYKNKNKLNTTTNKVFDALTTEIPLWWTEMFEGLANKQNETFTVRFGESVYKTILVQELSDNSKVVWQVKNSLIAIPGGYDFDSDTKTYFDSVREPSPIFYPYIDFILLLDKVEGNESEDDLEMQGRNQLFMRKGLELNDRYFKGTYDPVIRNLAGLVRSLLIR